MCVSVCVCVCVCGVCVGVCVSARACVSACASARARVFCCCCCIALPSNYFKNLSLTWGAMSTAPHFDWLPAAKTGSCYGRQSAL